MKILNRLSKYIKNKKGLSSIETGILSIVIIFCIGGLTDLNGVMQKFNTLSTTANYISRIVGKQGGVRMYQPSGFDGTYINSSKLYSDVKKAMNDSGIEDKDFSIEIDGQTLKGNSNTPIKTRGEKIPVKLTIKYEMGFISNLTMNSKKYTKTAERDILSSFKNRTEVSGTTSVD